MRSAENPEAAARQVAGPGAGGVIPRPERFWLSVLGALRQTVPGAALVRALTAAPELAGGPSWSGC